MKSRSSFHTALTFLSITAALAGPAFAQHMGHGSGAGQTQGSGHGTHGTQTPMMAGDQMTRNVESMMTNIESMMRDLSAMPMAGSQHEQMMAGLTGMLEQMRGVHGSLTGMMHDPQLMQNGDAMKAFNQAGRDLERMASAFQSMTKNMNQAMKGLHSGQK